MAVRACGSIWRFLCWQTMIFLPGSNDDNPVWRRLSDRSPAWPGGDRAILCLARVGWLAERAGSTGSDGFCQNGRCIPCTKPAQSAPSNDSDTGCHPPKERWDGWRGLVGRERPHHVATGLNREFVLTPAPFSPRADPNGNARHARSPDQEKTGSWLFPGVRLPLAVLRSLRVAHHFKHGCVIAVRQGEGGDTIARQDREDEICAHNG